MLNVVLKCHRSALRAGTEEAQKLFVMMKLIPQEEVAQARPPLNIALVIDTSGSMVEFADQAAASREAQRLGLQGIQESVDGSSVQSLSMDLPTKMDRALEAAHRLVDDERFRPEDRLALVHFDDDASLLLPLTSLAGKKMAHDAIEGLRQYSGGTQMGKGLRVACEALGDVPPQCVKRVFLLTDGRAFDEQDCHAAAQQLAAGNTPVTALGLGTEYNEALMRDLAGVTRGRPYHLQDVEQFAAYLDEEVGSAVKEVVTDLRASVALAKGVSLDGVTRVYPSMAEVGTQNSPYLLGNIAAGNYTVFLLEFTISGIARPPSRARVAQVGLAGQVPALGRRDELEVQDLFTAFTDDEAAIAAVDPEVLGYVQQKNVDRMMQEAVGLATVDVGRARQTLQVAAGMTQRLGNAAVTQMLQNALDELDATGSISAETRKTVSLGGRTRTVMTGSAQQSADIPSEEEIRRKTGL